VFSSFPLALKNGQNLAHSSRCKVTAFPCAIHILSTSKKARKPATVCEMAKDSGTHEEFSVDFRLLFPVYTAWRHSYSWQAFKDEPPNAAFAFCETTTELSKKVGLCVPAILQAETGGISCGSPCVCESTSRPVCCAHFGHERPIILLSAVWL
jgi:hypothetical protein